jgi:hypothetical protein
MSRITDTAIPRRKDSPWQFVLGVIMADLSVLLIAVGGWDVLNSERRMLIYVSGSILLLVGLGLVVSDTIKLAELFPQPVLTCRGMYLGRFSLNGFMLEAYERETSEGRKEFRLVSTPSVRVAQEAAFVRYVVNEGLVDNLWPHLSERIQKEADWAFVS